MNIELTAQRLASLGHASRLELFQHLVRAGHNGLTVGELQSVLDSPSSTLAFHLRELVAAGMVSQEKEGRMVRCRANFAAMNEMLQSVMSSCCAGITVPELTIPQQA